MAKKALLMILDGWGIGPHDHSNAIYETPKPYWDSLIQNIPTPNFRLRAKTSDFLTDRWVTAKLVTSTSAPDASFIKIW